MVMSTPRSWTAATNSAARYRSPFCVATTKAVEDVVLGFAENLLYRTGADPVAAVDRCVLGEQQV
jgi:hypothetical protein